MIVFSLSLKCNFFASRANIILLLPAFRTDARFYYRMPENPIKILIFWCNSGPSGVYSSLKDPLTLGGGVCSTPLSLGGGMCSTSLSSGLLQSHVSSLSLPSVSSVSNTQVATINYNCLFWERIVVSMKCAALAGCLTGSSRFQLCLQPDLHSAFCQLPLICADAGTNT